MNASSSFVSLLSLLFTTKFEILFSCASEVTQLLKSNVLLNKNTQMCTIKKSSSFFHKTFKEAGCSCGMKCKKRRFDVSDHFVVYLLPLKWNISSWKHGYVCKWQLLSWLFIECAFESRDCMHVKGTLLCFTTYVHCVIWSTPL